MQDEIHNGPSTIFLSWQKSTTIYLAKTYVRIFRPRPKSDRATSKTENGVDYGSTRAYYWASALQEGNYASRRNSDHEGIFRAFTEKKTSTPLQVREGERGMNKDKTYVQLRLTS